MQPAAAEDGSAKRAMRPRTKVKFRRLPWHLRNSSWVYMQPYTPARDFLDKLKNNLYPAGDQVLSASAGQLL